jgi:hypothetical protein
MTIIDFFVVLFSTIAVTGLLYLIVKVFICSKFLERFYSDMNFECDRNDSDYLEQERMWHKVVYKYDLLDLVQIPLKNFKRELLFNEEELYYIQNRKLA